VLEAFEKRAHVCVFFRELVVRFLVL